tara:strand:- start:39376 stop:39564 length:189 start_codon:yes stop_codon:yes gene_type:complete
VLPQSSALKHGVHLAELGVPSTLRVENKIPRKMLEQAQTFFWVFYLFVTAEGFKPPTLRAEI